MALIHGLNCIYYTVSESQELDILYIILHYGYLLLTYLFMFDYETYIIIIINQTDFSDLLID